MRIEEYVSGHEPYKPDDIIYLEDALLSQRIVDNPDDEPMELLFQDMNSFLVEYTEK